MKMPEIVLCESPPKKVFLKLSSLLNWCSCVLVTWQIVLLLVYAVANIPYFSHDTHQFV